MRHANKVKKLGRTHAHRKATLSALSTALITHKRITTTLAKAKALRTYVEPILHRAKDDSTNSRRQAFRHLQDKEAVKALFGEIGASIGDRPGGYTRVVKLGQRAGDAAEMAVIELVDFNDVKPDGAAGTKKKTRRGRRPAKGDAAAKTSSAAAKGAAKGAAKKATGPDDFTKLFGIGEVFANALHDAGINTYAKLAKADLYTLRDAIQEHTKVSDEAANEETWAAQAALAAKGDWDGLAELQERIKAGEAPEAMATTEGASNEGGAPKGADQTPPDEPTSPMPPEVQAGSGTHPESADQRHSDAPQGGAAGTGPPPPESFREGHGRGGQHRG